MRRRLRKNPITERPMAVKARRLLVSVENTIFMSSDSDTLQDAMVVPGTWYGVGISLPVVTVILLGRDCMSDVLRYCLINLQVT